jgi:hypothetical protein
MSFIRTLATSMFAMPSAAEQGHDQPAQRRAAGRKFRRFGRMDADGRVISHTDHDPAHRLAADGWSDERYLDHGIDTQNYGKPLPISGQFFGQAGWGY